MYKIETHAHTKPVSGCGKIYPKDLIDCYKKVGYSGVTITNHFTKDFFREPSASAAEKYLSDYEEAKAEGDKIGIKVYLGAEFRFARSVQDFLIFGITRTLVDKMMYAFDMSYRDFRELVHSEGALFWQAHPFRHEEVIIPANCLDGIEICNMHFEHNSHNAVAKLFAEERGLKVTSGSDAHEYCHIGRGGLLSEILPENNEELCGLIMSQKFELIHREDYNFEKDMLKFK